MSTLCWKNATLHNVWLPCAGKICPYRIFAPPCVGRQHYNHFGPPFLEKCDPMPAGKVKHYSIFRSLALEKFRHTAMWVHICWRNATLQHLQLFCIKKVQHYRVRNSLQEFVFQLSGSTFCTLAEIAPRSCSSTFCNSCTLVKKTFGLGKRGTSENLAESQ